MRKISIATIMIVLLLGFTGFAQTSVELSFAPSLNLEGLSLTQSLTEKWNAELLYEDGLYTSKRANLRLGPLEIVNSEQSRRSFQFGLEQLKINDTSYLKKPQIVGSWGIKETDSQKRFLEVSYFLQKESFLAGQRISGEGEYFSLSALIVTAQRKSFDEWRRKIEFKSDLTPILESFGLNPSLRISTGIDLNQITRITHEKTGRGYRLPDVEKSEINTSFLIEVGKRLNQQEIIGGMKIGDKPQFSLRLSKDFSF